VKEKEERKTRQSEERKKNGRVRTKKDEERKKTFI
jgi:hypothetical protein